LEWIGLNRIVDYIASGRPDWIELSAASQTATASTASSAVMAGCVSASDHAGEMRQLSVQLEELAGRGDQDVGYASATS
jgi:hypothetical protein